MADVKYTYSVATDTLNALADISALQKEIRDSAIVTAHSYNNMLGDVLDVYMKATLSAGDETALDAIVAAHTGVALPDDWVQKTTHQDSDKTPVQKIQKVSVYKAEGSGATIVSHDWTDPCSWYKQSTRVIAETLTLDTGKIYDFANTNIIDLTHGRLYSEDDFLAGHELKVYDNAVLKTEGTDYTMNYETGVVTFDAGYSVTTPVTADYSYENGSCWVLAPDAGTVLHLEHAELNFSKDISMSSVSFEIWVYNPADLPNKIMYKRLKYKNIKDIINSANLGQGVIPAIGGLTKDVVIFPFNYVTLQSLKASDGAELRVSIDNETAFTGEWATATFYVMSEAE